MNFFKNLVLFFALFAGGLFALDYMGVIHVETTGILDSLRNRKAAVSIQTGDSNIETLVVNGVEVILCEGMTRSEIDPITKKVTCVPAITLNTQCIGPDGEAYDENTKKTFYRNAEKTKTNLRPRCEKIEKQCINGNFVSVDTTGSVDSSQYAFLECYVIDRTVEDVKTCRGDNGLEYAVGSTRIRFIDAEVVADDECKSVQEYCGDQGEWVTKFPSYTKAMCEFKGTLSPDYIRANTGKVFTEDAQFTTAAKGTLDLDTSKASCILPWGERILHGEKKLSFKEKVVKFDEECVARTHTCVDGSLEFVTPYPYPTCTIQAPQSCTITETNVTISHGSKKTLYKKPTLVNGEYNCDEQTRYCYDGALDGDAGYIYDTCGKPKVTENPNKCPNPYVGESKALEHGREGVAYYKNIVGINSSCDGEVDGKINKVAISCQYGSIQPVGNGVKLRRSCVKGTPKSCVTPWGSAVTHGASVVAFQNSSVSYTSECVSETRVCNDGKLGGSFQYSSCTQTNAASCTTPWGSIISNGQNVQAFQSEIVPYGSSCIPETRICSNGKLGGSFIFRSCTQESPKDCVYNGATVKHGQIIARYKEPQVIGQVADGTDQCTRYTATCTNGTLQGSLMSHPEAVYLQCTTTIPNNGSN